MADNVNITPGTGNIVAADEVTDGALGTVKVQYIKLMDGTLDSTNKLIVTASGAATVDGSGVTQPISGSVSVSNFPATQPVSGTVTANAGTGTFAVSAVSLPLPTGASTSANQTNGNQTTQILDGAGHTWNIDPSGTGRVNVVTSTALTVSGTVTANIGTTGGLALDATLTGGSQETQIVQGGNTAVVDATGDLQVDVNNFPSSTTITGNVTVVQPTGTNLHTVVDSGTITLSGTSPVSGTVTANQGTPNSLANGWPVELSDGTNLLGVAAHPVRVDPTGTTTQPVSGTVTANAGTGNFTVVQATAANLNATVTGTVAATQSGTWNINNISGTISLPTGASTSALQTTGNTSLASIDLKTNDTVVAISLTAVAQTSQVALQGHNSAAFNLTSVGTGGQVVVEGSIDGTNWFQLDVWSEFLESWVTGTITTTGNWWTEPVGALNAVRIRVTAITSGTITGTWLASTIVMGTFEYQGSAGTNLPPNMVYVAGKTNDGTPQIQPIPLTASGASVKVDGSAVTQPVSGTVSATQGTSPWVENLTQVNSVALGSPSAYGTSPGAVNVIGVNANITNPVQVAAANLSVTATGAAAAAVTATLPAVAGQFHYITGIEILAYTTVARTGSATVVLVTSTNLPGSNVWDFQSAAAIGTSERQLTFPNSPIKSATVNTNTTIVAPATTSVIWRINVYYFTAA